MYIGGWVIRCDIDQRIPILTEANTGSDVRTSSNFAESIRNVNGFNGINWQEINNLHLLYNKTTVDLRFGRHAVLLNSKLNHIDLRPASVNMTFTVQ